MTHKIKEVTHKSYNAPDDSDNDFLCAVQLQRIANSLEEVIRLVKQDQEKFERYKEETTEKWEPGTCK